MEEIIKPLYFLFPAYFANMAPVFVSKVFKKNWPLDFGKKYKNLRILGSHKTIQGFVGGVFISTLAGWLQYAYSPQNWLLYFDSGLLIGFLQGFGALTGDAVKSFFKRRINIKPGQPWIPYDQIDYVIGALLFSSFVYFVGWWQFMFLIIVSALLHIAVNHIGYWLGIRDVKW
ncbi:CDP-archaeol synthase [Candidatus Woesearchaeota archaeon]|nr:CDP-archaeol synthase [Candidatus Woesearchaeota archaeon]